MNERPKFIAGLIILLATLALGVWQWSETEALKLETSALNTEIANYSAEKAAIQEDNQALKVALTSIRGTSEQQLDSVFPTNEDITELTRLFDEFSVKNNFTNNAFFISNINYEAAAEVAESAYRYVPFSIQLTASRKNLNKFIEYIETSGSLESGVRLMEIEDMRISYPSEDVAEYTAEFKLRAYFSQDV